MSKSNEIPGWDYTGPAELVKEFKDGKINHCEFLVRGGKMAPQTQKWATDCEREQATIIRKAHKANDELKRQRDGAYRERNQLLAALSRSSDYTGYLAEDQSEKEPWTWVVFLYKKTTPGTDWKPTQMTWHIHDSELPLFDHLEIRENDWDGHDTTEKYRRLRKFA